jgi:hypothetical protein
VADDPPVSAEGDDVDAVPPQPCALVEAARSWARQLEPSVELEDRPLRWRPTHRELEEHRLADRHAPEPDHARRDPQFEAVGPGRPGDDQRRRLRLADVVEQQARVESVEPGTPPPPPGEQECERQRADPCPRIWGERREPGTGGSEHGSRRADPTRVRSSETEAAATGKHVWIGV